VAQRQASEEGFADAVQKNGVPKETARFQWQNRRYLGSYNNAETSVETVNGIHNIFAIRMHCKTTLLSGTIASAGG
jgi:hypothetical protein